MSNNQEASMGTRIRVGLFTAAALLLVGVVTVLVNDKPFWWRPCQQVHINIQDATGLKMKSPVRSLGIEIGYLKSINLTETYVDLGICITAPIEVLPNTRAYIRGEGFLGDRFVELHPVRYTGGGTEAPAEAPATTAAPAPASSMLHKIFSIPEAHAEEAPAPAPAPVPAASPSPVPGPKKTPTAVRTRKSGQKEIPVGEQSQDVQAVVNRVDNLVGEMTKLTTNLRESINPEELRSTMRQLNHTLENASKTLSPEGGLNQTAQRTMAKLEDAVEQLRAVLTRINQGEGSIGKIVNDPSFADDLHSAIKSMNKLLGRAGEIRFVVNMNGEKISGYQSGRGTFSIQIWPTVDRYYLLGVSVDPRGLRTVTTTTTEAGGQTTIAKTTSIEETGFLFTGMLGKVFFHRLDLSIGAYYGDGDASAAFYLGPDGKESKVQVRADIYARGSEHVVDERVRAFVNVYSGLYLSAGVESFRTVDGKFPWSYGAGVAFDDEDIKLLFALK